MELNGEVNELWMGRAGWVGNGRDLTGDVIFELTNLDSNDV